MKSNERKSFLLYFNFAKQFRMLTLEERGELITAIFDYAEHGKTDEKMSPRVELVFSFIADVLDIDRAEYDARCEQNRENGKKGGRPKKPFAESTPFFSEKTERFSKEPKKPDTDIDTDTDTDIDTDTEKETELTARAVGEALMGARSAPLGPPSLPAPRETKKEPFLDEEAYRSLIRDGVDGSYIRAHEKSATDYAAKHGTTVSNVLYEWWIRSREGQSKHPASTQRKNDRTPNNWSEQACASSFETDEFFQAAIQRSLQWDGR